MLTQPIAEDAPGASEKPGHVRVAIVGAGFSGLGLAIRLRQQGMRDFVVLERAADVAGTWRDNTYPGCACDVQSHLYSFSFAPNPHWSRRYSPQPEIWAYLRDCAERYGIMPHLRYGAEVRAAAWDDAASVWRIETARGPLTADVLALGNGPLSDPSIPQLPGLDTFAGTAFHSARWNHAHDLRGKRVAVVGTGASAIQFVPQIQPLVERLMLYQRTPAWIMPRDDRAIPPWRQRLYARLPQAQQLVRTGIYWQREISVLGLVYYPQIVKRVARQALAHLAAQVPDPRLRATLTPNYLMGCKRILLSDDFYPAISQPNAEVVTERIRAVRPGGIVTEDGQERATDTIIFATGFHVTDMPVAGRVCGRDGRSLAEVWSTGPQAYLGTTVAGFPNLFLLIGPNTGLGHNSMVFMIEAQLSYILDCLRQLRQRGARAVEVRADAQQAYNDRLQQRLRGTVWMSGCKSWYLDAGGRNSTIWPGFTWEYWLRTRRFDAPAYTFSPAHTTALAGRAP